MKRKEISPWKFLFYCIIDVKKGGRRSPDEILAAQGTGFKHGLPENRKPEAGEIYEHVY